ncbi:hypothetical protein [Salegentibacter mishustinae]|uniref:Uncharacterized protein n=1 Tax=Salegentibacter mishustinae TaxID=270918 RepID=A0A0Q9ZKM4_9FLAO|nr:hypothetical protein [Salegentibacter mishustinae]KRG28979.1 hypothetical protein APR42_03360 [Salegentibacter mishustinae]PNW21970.1 hypothetical protein APB85_12135 [Salegentibacter mishustinae]PZX65325.1 hypothetical protein LY54_01618 [Salegentibacter mishustinae]GGW85812.1 hypothetical protein GCM10008086_12580 [Salegentibacter mishustinae]
MKNAIYSLMILAFSFNGISQEKYLSEETQIKMASMAAPEEDRDSVTVYGYNKEGKVVLLKEGTNNLVCIADDPNMNGISVSCYNKKLEPFMSRGRELKAEGKDMMETRAVRKQEVESGKLKMPDAPSMTYILSGKEANLNRETGELKDAKLRYVIYMPYATTEETGLPDKPHTPGMPWLMDPGTHRAHIMITPADKN